MSEDEWKVELATSILSIAEEDTLSKEQANEQGDNSGNPETDIAISKVITRHLVILIEYGWAEWL